MGKVVVVFLLELYCVFGCGGSIVFIRFNQSRSKYKSRTSDACVTVMPIYVGKQSTTTFCVCKGFQGRRKEEGKTNVERDLGPSLVPLCIT